MASARRLSIVIGGVAYKMLVDARHAASLATLARLLPSKHDVEIAYEHTSVLPQGRARWLHSAADSDADLAISVDSDVAFDARHLLPVVEEMGQRATDSAIAMLGVLCPQSDGRVNAWNAHGERLDEIPPGQVVKVWAIGMGIVVYNLDWYRRTIPDGKDLLSSISLMFGTFSTGNGNAFIGEDVYHCDQIHARGGQIAAVRLPGVGHASRV